jgi:hypothetical protein
MVLFFLEQLIFNFIIYITHCYLPQNIVLIASVSLILGYLLAFKFIGRIDVTEYLFAWKILCMQVLRLTSLLSHGSPFLVLEAVKDRKILVVRCRYGNRIDFSWEEVGQWPTHLIVSGSSNSIREGAIYSMYAMHVSES